MATSLGVASSIVGLVSSVLGLISFDRSRFPPTEPAHCGIRIAVGLDVAQSHSTLSGTWPDIRLWNEKGEAIAQQYDLEVPKNRWKEFMSLGNTDHPAQTLGSGEHFDSQIELDHAQQPTYALFTGNQDAICIAYISQTWPDEQGYAWLGSWGKQCGKSWYYSQIYLDDADQICTWLDKDNTATNVKGFQVHFPEFRADSNGVYEKDVDYYCNHDPVMKFYIEPNKQISYWLHPEQLHEAAEANKDKRRSINGSQSAAKRHPTFRPSNKAAAAFDHRLTKSNRTLQLASELCKSETSVGPDFLSLEESKFCDMKTKTVWPACATKDDKNCFDTDVHDMRLFKSMGKREVRSLAMAKNYTQIAHWV